LWIGGSAGSLEVLLRVLPHLNTDLQFPIVIVLHRKKGMDNLLADLFATKTQIPVFEIEEKQHANKGCIYIAPADYHLLIEADRTFSFDHSEKINYSRPSIDVAFESAAEVYQDKMAALLLSGANADGVNGLKKVALFGGFVMIQDPESASVSYMPAQAASLVDVNKILKIDEMAELINSLAK